MKITTPLTSSETFTSDDLREFEIVFYSEEIVVNICRGDRLIGSAKIALSNTDSKRFALPNIISNPSSNATAAMRLDGASPDVQTVSERLRAHVAAALLADHASSSEVVDRARLAVLSQALAILLDG